MRRRVSRPRRGLCVFMSRITCSTPEGAGTSATYHYRHFLQLLAIKLRQREGLTLDAIQREMRELTGDALERRVAQSLAPSLLTGTPAAAQHDDELSSLGAAS